MTDSDGHAISFKVLSRGTVVRSRDHHRVGTVRRVQENVRENIFDGIVIDTDQGRRFVDAPEVAGIYEHAVVLTISRAEVPALPEPPNPVAERLKMSTITRRAQRLGRDLRNRWDRR